MQGVGNGEVNRVGITMTEIRDSDLGNPKLIPHNVQS